MFEEIVIPEELQKDMEVQRRVLGLQVLREKIRRGMVKEKLFYDETMEVVNERIKSHKQAN